MPSPFIGEIRVFAGSFAPQGWALCDGQVLPIGSYTALFSILGTTYGGNGVSTFALPDLRGRVPLGPGSGPGLTPRNLGESAGAETHTLTVSQLPSHTHSLGASTAVGNSDSPAGRVMARSPAAVPQYAPSPDTVMGPNATNTSGGDQPHNNMQSSLTLNFIIAMQGIYPAHG